jgi:hypothetical protein
MSDLAYTATLIGGFVVLVLVLRELPVWQPIRARRDEPARHAARAGKRSD